MPPTPAAPREEQVGADADHPVAAQAPERGREAGGPVPVAGDLPGDGARDPPAVERERRDQVEREQQHVDRGQVAEHRGRGARRRSTRTASCAARRSCSRSPSPARSTDRRSPASRAAPPPRPGTPRPARWTRARASPRRRTSTGRCPRIGIPFRIATQAWPSSCSRIERKKRSALRTASTNAFESGGRVLVVVGQVPDDQEEDEEPAEVHPDPDPEDPAQLNRAAEHRSRMVGQQPVGTVKRDGYRSGGRSWWCAWRSSCCCSTSRS